MSRERSLVRAIREVKVRKHHRDLAKLIADQMDPENVGIDGRPIYRNAHVARRHLLIDWQKSFRKRRCRRCARRVAKCELRAA